MYSYDFSSPDPEISSLEKLHLDAITKAEYDPEDKAPNYVGFAAKSAQITKDIAIEFGRWVIANPELGNTSTMSRETAEYHFEKFLKTKE